MHWLETCEQFHFQILNSLDPVDWKFMVCLVGVSTLKSMVHTNHKLPGYMGVMDFF